MTIADRNRGDGSDALDSQAAHWFARMRAPDAGTSRKAFGAWLAESPEHRTAYNRAAEIYARGKLLAEPDAPVAARPRRRVFAAALTAVVAGALGLGAWALWQPGGTAPDRREVAAAITTDQRTVSTVTGETRIVRLADGSTLRLAGDSAVAVDIASGYRRLNLVRGSARFEVAHDGRSFVVFAAGGSVTARGTIFEVTLAPSGKVDVRLLQGAIDVALPRRQAGAAVPVRKLVAGESLSFAGLPEPAPTAAPGASVPTPTSARDFEATPVADLVALANRGAARPIRLADSGLGAERVSGRFRIDDTALLARRLGALFGRGVDLSDPREIVLAAASDRRADEGIALILDRRHAAAADGRARQHEAPRSQSLAPAPM